jgi:hypothetical protein
MAHQTHDSDNAALVIDGAAQLCRGIAALCHHACSAQFVVSWIFNNDGRADLQHVGVDAPLSSKAISQLPAEFPSARHPDQIAVRDFYVNAEGDCDGFRYSLYITLNRSEA